MSSFAVAQSASSAPGAYRPGLGDLMTMTVQPRHIKLALAGQEKNWPYAKYELHELQEAFERSVQVWPKFKGLPLGGMVDAIAKGPMATVTASQSTAKDVPRTSTRPIRNSPRAATPVIRPRTSVMVVHQGAGRFELPRPGFPAAGALRGPSPAIHI